MAFMTIRETLQKKEKELIKLISIAEKEQREFVDETIQISMVKGKPRYYHHYRDVQGKKHLKYISARTDLDKIKELAQCSYTGEFLETAYEQLNAVRAALKNINEESLANVFGMLHPERKKLIMPFVPDDEEFVRKWENVEYPPGYFKEGLPEIYSERGERVRSKSEKIIADKYNLLKIPYRYEQPLILLDRGKKVRVRPDFTVLNIRTRTQRYHEHLGKMDDPEYINKNIYKLRLYEKNGIFVGDQLILTYETADQPLDMKHFEALIQRFLT